MTIRLSIITFLNTVRAKYATGDATEHSYRAALEALFEGIEDGLTAVNEPRRVACGAPDFVVKRGGIDIGHCEAKDLHIDLEKLKDANADQRRRYLKALPNLIYTNGLDFEFYKSGEKVRSISIGTLSGGKIEAHPDEFETLANQLRAFAAERPQSISSAKKLAEMMAGKAVLIKDIMGNALRADAHLQTELTSQYAAFKAHLIHDIDADEFADVYAETIAYGLFAARLHDNSIDSFDRREALELLPKSNPFLRSLFGYIAGVDLDDRIAWVIDELCEVLRACNVHELMADFGKWTARNDPFLHFYETFLAEYNPAKRKARGVWYTPEPVVNFIVRAVDDVLKSEFGLPMGLADTSKITVDWDTGQVDKKGNRTTIKKDVHRVQILDPATGTGTFLAEAIKQIAAKVKGVAPGMWSNYVEAELIPRIHGFELLMASYAMCHMKIDMMLADLGYVPTAAPPRLSVYLTNSLEEGDVADQQLPFARWLSEEAKGANTIKRDTPIMCVIGNPPYSGESANKGDWIMGLMEAYKKEPGGKSRLDERNPKWINDDYVKFIRFAEHMIAKNGEGVLGFITNHGYLDNPTFRGVRSQLLDSFDKIYVLDLHGSTNRKELVPADLTDKNVFDIKPGVALIIAIKKRGVRQGSRAEVYHSELWGPRELKNASLFSAKLHSIKWTTLALELPHLMFVPWDYETERLFRAGFALDDLMPTNSNGIVTGKDSAYIAGNADALRSPEDRDDSLILRVNYRLFEESYIYFEPDKLARARTDVMQHYIRHENVGLLTTKAFRDRDFSHAFLTTQPSEAIFLSATTGSNAMNMPLYLYPTEGTFGERRVNFTPSIHKAIIDAARAPDEEEPSPERILDYIYGVLHSPTYRAKYRQALTIDYPHIPYPPNSDVFAEVAELGGQLRRLHLMDDVAIGETPYPFQGNGSGEVFKPEYVAGRVHITPDQWFDNVPAVAWGFHIGGYQPAQKWLKDRKGRALSFDDVRHYQKIIKILVETDRIMNEIDLPLH